LAESAELAPLIESYLDLRWHLDPVAATAAGLTDYDSRLGTYSEEQVRQHLAAFKSTAIALEAASLDSIDEEIDRTALLNDIRVTIQRFDKEQPHVNDPGFWVSHVLEGLYFLLVLRDRPLEHRSSAACGRLKETAAFLEDPETKKYFQQQFIVAAYKNPEQFQQYIKVELGRWADVVRTAGIKAE